MTLFKMLILAMVAFIVIRPSVHRPRRAWITLQRFGLTGVWAYFCERHATRINYFETYAGGPDGLARREVDRGIDIPIGSQFYR